MQRGFLVLVSGMALVYCHLCEAICSSNPCDNGGTCVVSGIAYTCKCHVGRTGTHCEGKNWALGRYVTQSSQYYSYVDGKDIGHPASNAVDGITNRTHPFCTHTNAETYPWWRVAFGIVLEVEKVVIHNRETLTWRLKKFDIVVGIYDGRYRSCGPRKKTMSGVHIGSFYCSSGVKGRNLAIILRTRQALTLCEVLVYGQPYLRDQCASNPCDNAGTCEPNGTFYKCVCLTPWTGPNCEGPNWARGQSATMSSSTKYVASRAVDGIADDMMAAGSCSSTRPERNPWWKVTFGGKMIEVLKVVILNRQDCCYERLVNFSIVIGSQYGLYSVCGARLCNMSDMAMKGFYVSRGVYGSNLKITLHTKRWKREKLTLCEVYVYGVLRPCRSNPCLKGEKCVPNKIHTSYECLCPASFTGTNCENRLTCSSNPCENGGTCIGYVDSYNCTCPANWIGSHCETEEEEDELSTREKAAIAAGAVVVTATIGGIFYEVIIRLGIAVVRKTVITVYHAGDEEEDEEDEENEDIDDAMWAAHFNEVASRVRYSIGSETSALSEQLTRALGEPTRALNESIDQFRNMYVEDENKATLNVQ